ncbi:GNAT family N-acetyltransferase [Methanogenium sp. S4BF]|uniref:GNAT family N-acetyltransferase n=1 Tax=Methanogenium sp. S4BF TaxID=1789226 RepID=UPI0024169F7F|nr:GNAT family N-acetyltransferase [Methanogenium sp. S4BF]WFN35124.1 GNAT family N-acetyltransferase [Methanogenium sp. S4BF]
MGFYIQIADDNHQKEWDDYIQSSSFGTIFHTWQWLKIMEKHTNSTLYPLQIFKGTTHIASYPIFFKKKGFVKVALSPPYNTDILYLGPVISHYESFKQPKKEEYLMGIQSEIDKFLFSDLGCNYVNLRTAPGLLDSRSLRWAGYHVEPLYSYRLDLNTGLDNIWTSLHRSVRKNIKNAQDKGIVIEKGDKDDLFYIHSEIQRRFGEQGRKKDDILLYLDEVFHQYNGRNLDIFVAKYLGETVSGVIHLNYNGIMYQWVGLPKEEIDGISPNDLLVWESIKSGREMGMRYYDIMDGGDNPRLRRFKSKFNPELSIWYSAEKYSHPIYGFARTASRKTGYHVKI